ncbi:MAG: Gfo/Idh/MocA family oxidoreductase [Yoonia sp.]|uniref:Gfo/Idh/MocA family protein n=1 Tax=Yoonia sp. TaxID=2212373 RepID=UPI00326361B8
MKQIGIGIVGGGYMGKAHAVAHSAVGALFDTALRPRLEMVCATNDASAEKYRNAYGFQRGTSDWKTLVLDEKVEAIVIASPQSTHREIAELAFSVGKPVFCEKPLGRDVADSRAMVAAAEKAGAINMSGFNYIRTPASQYAKQLLDEGVIGEITSFRGEHTEDFMADPQEPATWRTDGLANGCMGDLSPHPINCALRLMGPIEKLIAEVETVIPERPGGRVTNDDHAQIMCRFASGVLGNIYVSRTATGRKMGYKYEITGTKGAIYFDGEDQNAIHLYKMDGPDAQRGFTKILTGPAHPDYKPFCLGPGHGTGYQDQIIIEAKDFLTAIHTGENIWPTFRDGMEVNQIVATALAASQAKTWLNVNDF